MKFDWFKKYKDKVKHFRHIKQDGSGFVYYTRPNEMGYIARSPEELYKIIHLNNSIAGVSCLSFFLLYLLVCLYFYSYFNDGALKSLLYFGVFVFLCSIALLCFAYWTLNNKYEKVEPEIKTIKDPIWVYNLKIFSVTLFFFFIYFLTIFMLAPQSIYFFSEFQHNDSKTLNLMNLALKIKPQNEKVYIDRAWIYYRLGDYNKALDDFNKAISLKPDNARFYLDRGDIFYELGDYKKALKDYDKAISMQKDAYCFISKRGLFYYKTGEYEKAIKDFHFAYKKGHDDLNLFSIGLAKEAQNDYCGAYQFYANIKNNKDMNDLNAHKQHSKFRCYSK